MFAPPPVMRGHPARCAHCCRRTHRTLLIRQLQLPPRFTALSRLGGLMASPERPSNTHSKLLDDGTGALDLVLLPREHGVVALPVS